MQEEGSNYLGFGLFFFFIVFLIVVCSILLFFSVRNKRTEKIVDGGKEVVINDKNKQDKSKDFVYFTEEEVISEELNLIYKMPIINLKSEDAKKANEEIKSYVSNVKNTLQKGESQVCYNKKVSTIYKTNYIDLAVYNYEEYVTLLIRESEYSCENGFSSTSKVKAYTFDVLNGQKISFNALLEKYNRTLTNMLEEIRNHLKTEQIIIQETPNILIEETINGLKEQETYVLYINEFGDLTLNYVVKTNGVDYNDTITINRK